MLRVVTLPITPGRARPFLTLFNPFVADMIAKTTGAELIVMLNTVGIKSSVYGVCPEKQCDDYRVIMTRLGIKLLQLVHDGTDLYNTMFDLEICRMKSQSMLTSAMREISWCSCGKVEIPTEIVHRIISDKRQKTLIEGSSFSTAICSKCRSSLKTGRERVQVIRFPKVEVHIEPLLYTKEVRSIAQRIAEIEIIVSRYHRGPGEQFDTDFRWYGYIGHLANPYDEVIIVTSPTTLNQAVRVVAFNKLMYPQIKIRLLVHPLVRVSDDQTDMSVMSATNFLDFLETPLQARMFFAFGMQWSTNESKIYTKEIHLVRATSPYLEHQLYQKNYSRGDLFNRNDVCGLYKQLRRMCSLSPSQIQLAYCIQPSL